MGIQVQYRLTSIFTQLQAKVNVKTAGCGRGFFYLGGVVAKIRVTSRAADSVNGSGLGEWWPPMNILCISGIVIIIAETRTSRDMGTLRYNNMI